MTKKLPYERIEGKTYTLFGQSGSTSGYYLTVRKMTDQLLGQLTYQHLDAIAGSMTGSLTSPLTVQSSDGLTDSLKSQPTDQWPDGLTDPLRDPQKNQLADPMEEHLTHPLKDQSRRALSDIAGLLDRVSRLSSKKRRLNRLIRKPAGAGFEGRLVHDLHEKLHSYTMNTGAHLKGLPVLNLWDRRLGTTREQYHLYMIEIELTNRLFRDPFLHADRKIALLPYCLQDFSVKCKASVKGFDYQCNHCSGKCFENKASQILGDHAIEPYIWRDLDFRKLAAASFKKGQKFGVFGIACIPELVWGMRKCRRNGIPVMGLPLNANRCSRWFGDFFPNSIDLGVLEDMVRMTV